MNSPSASASPWAALLPTALAGTRRSPALAPVPGLTPPLGTEADAAEKQLFLTAANLRLVQRAGHRPALADGAEALSRQAPGPAEWPALSTAGSQHFLELLAEKDSPHKLWLTILKQLHAQRQRLPHRLLWRTLNIVGQLNPSAVLITYAPLFGRRGVWLASHHDNAALRAGAPLAAAGLRPDAPLAQRPAALSELHRADPARAWQYVVETLPTADEPTRLQLVEWAYDTLEDAPGPAALAPLLEPLPPPIPQYGIGAEKLHRFVWYAIQHLPDSAWSERLWARAAGCLTLERPPHQPPRLHLRLPTDAEAATEAWRQDGLKHSHEYSKTARGRERLKDLLEKLAPSRWAAFWGVSMAEAVDLLAALPQAAELLDAWLTATWQLHDAVAARALLPWLARHNREADRAAYAASALPPAEQAAWLQSVLPALPFTFPPNANYGPPPLPWLDWAGSIGSYAAEQPLEVAQVLLPFIRDFLLHPSPDSYYPWAASRLVWQLGVIADKGPLKVLPWYEAETPALARAHPQLAARIEQALRHLRIRQRLASSGTEPPGPAR